MAVYPVRKQAGLLSPHSTIYFTPVANLHNEDEKGIVLDATDNAIIAYAVFPELASLGTFEGFANAARVFQHGNTVM